MPPTPPDRYASCTGRVERTAHPVEIYLHPTDDCHDDDALLLEDVLRPYQGLRVRVSITVLKDQRERVIRGCCYP